MTTKLNAPVILISGGSADSASVQAAATMIAAQGAVPMIISNHFGRLKGKDRDGLYAEATRLMQKADGILVMGNFSDIDPSEYGQEKDVHTKSELNTQEGIARRNLETLLMRIALGAGVPMFGICGGMQRINVLCGGTLHKHIPNVMREVAHSEHAQLDLGIPLFIPVQPVNIAGNSTLGAIADGISTVYTPIRTVENEIRIDVNSMHHQAVDKVGEGLRTVATADDLLKDGSRLIEAIEIDPNGSLATGPLGNKRFGVFTQWHPEFSDNPLGAKIAQAFTEAAREFGKHRGIEHTLEEVRAENNFSALSVLKEPTKASVLRTNSFSERIVRDRMQRDPSFGLAT